MLESANACEGVLGSTRTTQGRNISKCMEVNEYEDVPWSVNESYLSCQGGSDKVC